MGDVERKWTVAFWVAFFAIAFAGLLYVNHQGDIAMHQCEQVKTHNACVLVMDGGAE